MRKLTCPPNTQVLGLLLNTYIDNLQGTETAPIMEKHGLTNFDPNGWYSLKNLLDGLNELAERGNVSANMTAIGMGIGQNVPIPPELPHPTLEQVLNIWDDLYQTLHRNGDAGCIRIEKISDKHFKTIHSVIYPDDMSYGV
ncbi:MAG TPA: hypothetical protein VHO69_02160, partial [Phototrophicaceae bacterium]|nr:hypothetical protein [Phototrophicaceae bacterium]